MKKQLGGKPSLIYNKERTKAKLVKAVGQILVKQGFQNIRINNIEKVSGVSKKAIYDYFGGLDGLIKEYLDQVDYWKTLKLPNNNPPLAQLGLIDEEFMFCELSKLQKGEALDQAAWMGSCTKVVERTKNNRIFVF